MPDLELIDRLAALETTVRDLQEQLSAVRNQQRQPSPARVSVRQRQEEPDEMRGRVGAVERQLNETDSAYTGLQHSRRPVFPAALTGVQWIERTPDPSGVLVDMEGGRACTDDADPSALMSLGANEAILLAMKDTAGTRYLPLGG